MQQTYLPSTIAEVLLNPSGSNLESLLQLNEFLHEMFSYDLPGYYFALLIASACWVGILIIFGVPILIYRLRKGNNLWFIKIVHKPEGVYVIPNAITSFVFFITLFGIFWITSCILEVTANKTKLDFIKNTVPAMQMLCWWPLLIASSCVAWGSFYSIPGALELKQWPKFIQFCFISKSPLLINIICLFTPIIVGISMIPLATLAQIKLRKSLNFYQIVHDEILTLQTSSITKSISFDESKRIFDLTEKILLNHLEMAKLTKIGFIVWSSFAIILIICYAIIGGKLNLLLYKQMKREYDLLDQSQKQKVKLFRFLRLPKRESKVISRIERGQDAFHMFNYDQQKSSTIVMTSNVPQSPTYCGLKSNGKHLSGSFDGHFTQVHSEMFEMDCPIQISNSSGPFRSHTNTQKDEYCCSSNAIQSLESCSQSNKIIQSFQYMRRCFFSLMILYFCILISLTIFTSTSLLWSIKVISSIRQGKNAITSLYHQTHLICAWTCIVFGTLASISIISRIFDPSPQQVKNSSTSTMTTTSNQIKNQINQSNVTTYSTNIINQTVSNPPRETSNQFDICSFSIVTSNNTSAIDVSRNGACSPFEISIWNHDKRVDSELEHGL